jgi:hypothetical protein
VESASSPYTNPLNAMADRGDNLKYEIHFYIFSLPDINKFNLPGR